MRLVLALGGNAILRRSDSGSYDEQVERAREVLAHVAVLAADRHEIVLTHGNGPVVGNIVVRNEAARSVVAPMPLFVDDADSQGGIGFLLQSELGNELRRIGVERQVVTLVTQVVVDPADPGFHRPTKRIGRPFDEDRAERLAREEGWFFSEDEPGLFVRVVPSPEPQRIVEVGSIAGLAADSTLVIACGGGGVPVVEANDGTLQGVEAVVDKDLASALLAQQLDVDMLAILMEAEAVFLRWGEPEQRPLTQVALADMRRHLAAGRFHEGSMAPKVEALCRFVESTGREALACKADDLASALAGASGTRVVPDVA